MPEQALELTRKAASLFAERGIENGRLEAELLLADVLGIDRLRLYLEHDRPLLETELESFRSRVRRRLKREPVQYILGCAHFRDLVLAVDPRVLIPRPETELLVGEVLRWAVAHEARSALDLGTGSGAIALSLAREGGFERVVAGDVSADALAVARANAAHHGLDGKVEFRHGSLWDVVASGEVFDVVVSNPPYVGTGEALPAEVRDWEPAEALFGGADGLAVIRDLVAGAPARLRPGGLLAVEIGATQAAAVAALLHVAGGAWGAPRVVKDLAGRDRIVLAERRP